MANFDWLLVVLAVTGSLSVGFESVDTVTPEVALKGTSESDDNVLLAKLNKESHDDSLLFGEKQFADEGTALRAKRAEDFQAALNNPEPEKKKVIHVNVDKYLTQLRAKQHAGKSQMGGRSKAAKALSKLNSRLDSFIGEDQDETTRKQRALEFKEALADAYTPHKQKPKAIYSPKTFSQKEVETGMTKLRKKSLTSPGKLSGSRTAAAKAIESVNRAEFFESNSWKYDLDSLNREKHDFEAFQQSKKHASKKQMREQELITARARKSQQKIVHDAILKLRKEGPSKAPVKTVRAHGRAAAAAILLRLNRSSAAEAKIPTSEQVKARKLHEEHRAQQLLDEMKASTNPLSRKPAVPEPQKKPKNENVISDDKVESYLSELRANQDKLMMVHNKNKMHKNTNR